MFLLILNIVKASRYIEFSTRKRPYRPNGPHIMYFEGNIIIQFLFLFFAKYNTKLCIKSSLWRQNFGTYAIPLVVGRSLWNWKSH